MPYADLVKDEGRYKKVIIQNSTVSGFLYFLNSVFPEFLQSKRYGNFRFSIFIEIWFRINIEIPDIWKYRSFKV